jgi:type IV pilus assembly protein PilV
MSAYAIPRLPAVPTQGLAEMKTMNKPFSQAKLQTGVMLIEALVALLIFSVGILGIVGLQASAIKASSDAKYRSEAALMANELIGKMWASNRTQATLQAAYASTNGTAYQTWAWQGLDAATPGTLTAPAPGTVMKALPGALANPPSVVITASTATIIPSSVVTVTVFWQAPGDTTVHNYIAIAQIGG